MRILDETVIGMTEAARALPCVDGTRLHPTCVWRWARRGVRGVKLETARIGGRVVTSREALGRFLAAIDGEHGS